MRDDIKSKQYFENNIKFLNEMVDAHEREDLSNIATTLTIYNLVKCKYCLGLAIKKLEDDVDKFLQAMFDCYESAYGIDVLLMALSLGVLFDVSENNMHLLKDKINDEHIEDLLIDTMVNYLDEEFEVLNDEIVDSKYETLRQLILASGDKSVQKKLLLNYLENWYELNDNAFFYDTHLSNYDDYMGYISFESAALSKIFELESDKFENYPHFPQELVDYKKCN